jgi:tetratricopeptide (TPR) repeat protein
MDIQMKPISIALAACLAVLAIFASTGASAQPVAAATLDDSALAARSAALSPAERTQAQSLFATAFGLWQSGDFAAAEIAFRQGLDIDPANALANYYYGDCLARRKDRPEARVYLERAVALGGSTAEAFKARAALTSLDAAPTDVASMTESDIATALIGAWDGNMIGSNMGPHFDLKILAVNGASLTVEGKRCYGLGCTHYTKGTIVGDQVTLIGPGTFSPDEVVTGRLFAPGLIKGTWSYQGNSEPFTATKK